MHARTRLAIATLAVVALGLAAAGSALGATLVETPGCPDTERWEFLAEIHRTDQTRTIPEQKVAEVIAQATVFAENVGHWTLCAAAVRVTIVDDPAPWTHGTGTLAALGQRAAVSDAWDGWDVVMLIRPARSEGYVGSTDYSNMDLPTELGGQPFSAVMEHEWLHILERRYLHAPWPDAIQGEDAIHECESWAYPNTAQGHQDCRRDLLAGTVAGNLGMRRGDWGSIPRPSEPGGRTNHFVLSGYATAFQQGQPYRYRFEVSHVFGYDLRVPPGSTLTASHQDGRTATAPLDENGEGTIVLAPGNWTVCATTGGAPSKYMERTSCWHSPIAVEEQQTPVTGPGGAAPSSPSPSSPSPSPPSVPGTVQDTPLDVSGGETFSTSPALGLPPFAAKLEVARARVVRSARRLSVLAPITGRASGQVQAVFRAAGRTVRLTPKIDSATRRVRINHRIPAAQARLGTGILTLTYGGDDDTQPQEVRLRAASRRANLDASRPRISNGRLTASGEISRRARGVVRLQLLYEPPGQQTRTLEFTARIGEGRYRFNERLPADVLAGVAARRGVVHSYTLFTGYFENRVRGEMQSFQVLGAR